ncbi:MAG: hypothetical protein SFU53_03510 [Terrimicrobiaceae bacterium]|nr:hypothetical protein [Terrimicrobiaceae bacterium]
MSLRSWLSNQWKWHVRPRWECVASGICSMRVKVRATGERNVIRVGCCSRPSSVVVGGDSNTVEIAPEARVGQLTLFVHGSGNRVTIGRGRFEFLEIHIHGDGCELVLESPVYISNACLVIPESNTGIRIGAYSMLATGIEIRTGDGHGIFDRETRERVNAGASVRIGRHVWLANRVNVMKGVQIADDVVVGSGSMVTSSLTESHAIYAGFPARQIRTGVTWNWSSNEFPDTPTAWERGQP